ncbi:bis(5'-nucleosyl)-tetraphosphatase (symmetrical) YqeK [Lactococcus protaetiae]|uniref:bis(5'-nucleosyl)-tetraphosphatase (symmetrical) n=1 Tax=Lactococcus protaetiae TaxID=2592653 RepID=A0A514ZB88_9LACT|nr:bis(5'-nucleosyl)-tetraphosphatase (symmetrical) YqeK [Lactococcus protaetiae]QDK71856.1 HD domain-containing protein [Lactococcus protaetiae]
MENRDRLIEKVHDFLNSEKLFEHSLAVATTAEKLAVEYDYDRNKAYIAGLLHDIGGVYPNDERVERAENFGISLLAEEYEFPLIIHQKLSKWLAKEKFKITDIEILEAVECHTTLRANYTKLDLILFLADKISWDGGDNAPFKEGLLYSLEDSMEAAALYYINFIKQAGLKVVHPWLIEAQTELSDRLKKLSL